MTLVTVPLDNWENRGHEPFGFGLALTNVLLHRKYCPGRSEMVCHLAAYQCAVGGGNSCSAQSNLLPGHDARSPDG